jgi:SpoVK/Ycf46/Vps4 family AAA+-type ATPase
VLLVEMDGVLGRGAEHVFVVATSTRPDLVDPALLRPGRLDSHLHLPAPNRHEREEILRHIMRDMPVCVETDAGGKIIVPEQFSLAWSQLEPESREKITQWEWSRPAPTADASSPVVASPADLRALFFHLLSHMTVHFSGADLVALHREAAMHALREDLSSTVVRSWRDVMQGTLRTMRGSLEHEASFHPFGRAAEWAAEFGGARNARSMFSKKTHREVVARNMASNAAVGVARSESVEQVMLTPFTAPFTMHDSSSSSALPSTFDFSAPPATSSTDAFSFSMDTATGAGAEAGESTPALTFSMGSTLDRDGTAAKERDAKRKPLKER